MRTLKSQPFVSMVLVAINVIVFIICHFTDDLLYDLGVLDLYSVMVDKEYGRIIWSTFLHSGMNHLFNNMLILFFMGSMIEKEVGHLGYGLLYFLSGIGGNLLSLWAKMKNHEIAVSLGASGAIFGLDGVLLALVLFSGRQMENVTPLRVGIMIAYSLYSGFTSKNVDNTAHMGGLITGFAIMGIICIWQRRKRERREGM